MPKNIVVCCDGTGNEYGAHNTNVVGLYERLLRNGDQIAYYDPGVGTFASFRALGPAGKKAAILLGQAFGYGIRRNIADAYEYLMTRYADGDRVYLFGFSRGAYTVRCLAALLAKCGLLQPGSANLIPYAIKMYLTPGNQATADGFKATFGRPCPVHLIGVWDTVSSLGLLLARRAFDPKPWPHARFGYHALSIDEHRAKFPAYFWEQHDADVSERVEQVWFAGVHSDIGGWYEERGLSNIALDWMLDRATRQGLLLQAGAASLNQDPAAPQHESRIGLWRLWRPAVRVIPSGCKVHRSVIERMQAPRVRTLVGGQTVRDATYRPANLPSACDLVD